MGVSKLSDPIQFARAVRALARDAHRGLTRSTSLAALRDLNRRIDVLAAALEDRRGCPIGAWLDKLGCEVRSAARQTKSSPPHAPQASRNPRSDR